MKMNVHIHTQVIILLFTVTTHNNDILFNGLKNTVYKIIISIIIIIADDNFEPFCSAENNLL